MTIASRAARLLPLTCALSICAGAALAQQEPAPAPAVDLPPVEVVGKKQVTKKKAVAKKAVAKKAAAPPPPAPAAPPEPPPVAEAGSSGDTTRSDPVEDYNANVSATATKSDTPLRETPQSVSVVGKEQMRDQAVQTLPEAFRYTPGVLADAFGVDPRADSISVRGLPASFFLDGMRSSQGFFPLTIEPYMLERAEVLRGPAAMLYGQGSTGGLINGISKLPRAEPYREISVEYGSFDFKQVKADFTGPLTSDGRWLYRVTGLARDADTQVDFVENDRLVLQPSLTFRPQADTSITLLGNFRKDQGGSVQQFFPPVGTLFPNVDGRRLRRSSFAGEPDDFYDTEGQSATLLIDHKFTPDLQLRHASRYSFANAEYVSHVPAAISPLRAFVLEQTLPPLVLPYRGGYLDEDQTQVLRLLTDQESESRFFTSDTNLTGTAEAFGVSHKVTAGFDYGRFDIQQNTVGALLTNPPPFGFDLYDPVYNNVPGYLDFTGVPAARIRYPEPRDTQTQTGLYVQDEIRIDNWIALLGVRHDWLTIERGRTSAIPGDRPEAPGSTVHEEATTLRGALMYQFDFGLRPYVSYSEAFTPQPGTSVLQTNDAVNFFSLLLDPSATPATRSATPLEGDQIELGFKFQPKNARWGFNAAVYDIDERNRIVDPDTILNTLQGAAVKIRGFEVEAFGQITPEFKVLAAYTYTDAEYTKYPDPLSSKVGTPLENAPRHLASLWGIYTWQEGFLKGLSVGGGVRYIGEASDVSPDLLSVFGEAFLGGDLDIQKITVPSYTLFDAMVAYETEDWRWSLNGANLADEYHVTACFVFRGDCFIAQGRTITTRLTYKF